jgi:quinol-cytochrome oxidoreductase complex cytochrome b subunit
MKNLLFIYPIMFNGGYNMKIGNVVLAIFLWLCIPAVILLGIFGTIPYSMSGGGSDSVITCVCGPAILMFIIGLVILIMGREKNHRVSYETQTPSRRCPNCGRVIPEDAMICPYCKKEF